MIGARRLAGWSLWIELAAVARLLTVWKGTPPILDERLGHDPCAGDDPGLAARLHQVVYDLEWDVRPWGSPPLDMGDLAEEFVISEVAAATGLSFTRARQRVDAATALFLTDRLPRTAILLRAGLLDETKLRTLLSGTADLDERTCRVVEARVMPDTDLEVAEPLDVTADPADLHARPGAALPAVTRMTNPALERALRAAVLAVDAEAAARRAAKARVHRHVRVSALDDAMGALTIETGQEIIAAIVNDLDSQVATAKAAGDCRRPDQIRCDELVHRMTYGAFGTPAAPWSRTGTATTAATATAGTAGTASTGCSGGMGGTSGSEGAMSTGCSGGTGGTSGTDGAATTGRSGGSFWPSTPAGPGQSGEHASPGTSGEPAGPTSQSPPSPTPPSPTPPSPTPPSPTPPCPPPSSPPPPGDGLRHGRYGRRGLTVGLTMPLSTWLGLTDEPGVLDGHGPIPGALARQIAADAARDHPQTTTWRCVVVDDRHRTVLGVGDLIPTPRHDPPPRVARLIATAEPTCVYPGCPTPAHRCDLDHRIPHERGGATCACNVQPLCRRHHRLKGTGAVTVRPAPPGSDVPPGTLTWTSWTGRSYEHRPPEAAVLPARPSDRAHAATVDSERRFDRTLHALAEDADADEPLTEEWTRSRRRQHEQDERQQNGRAARTARASRRPRPSADQQPDDDVPPF